MDSNYQDIYYIGRDGEVTWGNTQAGSDEKNGKMEPLKALESEDSHKPLSQEKRERRTTLDSRLTLIRLDVFFKIKKFYTKREGQTKDEAPQLTDNSRNSLLSKEEKTGILPPLENIPERYKTVLDNHFCRRCAFKSKILWRNIIQAESRYESRFRTFEDENDICFLHFHTMQVPYLDEKNCILTLVHHVSISRQNLVAQNPILDGSKDEKIFAFVLGLGILEMKEFLLRIFDYFQEETDEAGESSDRSAGVSPKLFISAILKLYGFNNTKKSIKSALEILSAIDDNLKDAEDKLPKRTSSRGKLEARIEKCNWLENELRELNQALTGVRSRLHYIGLCARGLQRENSTMDGYITDKWLEIRRQNHQKLRKSKSLNEIKTSSNHHLFGSHHSEREVLQSALGALESIRYTRRDNDKLDMISRAMTQYEVDIKSLKARTTIAVGLVGNLYSHSLLEASERDGKKMKVIASLTIFFLPATFFAIVFTTPMVQWPEFAPPPNPTPRGPGPDYSRPTLLVLPITLYVSLSSACTVAILFYMWQEERIMNICNWIYTQIKGGILWLLLHARTGLSKLISKFSLEKPPKGKEASEINPSSAGNGQNLDFPHQHSSDTSRRKRSFDPRHPKKTPTIRSEEGGSDSDGSSGTRVELNELPMAHGAINT